MIQLRLRPLGVPLHHRRISDTQLLRHEVQHHHRHVQRILQEGADRPDGHELEGEPELHVLATTTIHQHPVLVIEEAHPLQIHPQRHPGEPAKSRRLIISQKLHRHTPQSRTDPPVTNPEPPNRYKIDL
jgi:hypothetical protein